MQSLPSRETADRKAGRILKIGLLLGSVHLLGAFGPEEPHFVFVDVSRQSGLSRVLLAGRPDKDHLLDSAGSGVAWLDYDRDGLLDCFIPNGWKLRGREVFEKGRYALYRNLGNGTFQDVTDRAGVGGGSLWADGIAVADFDNDGWPDILVTRFGPNALYRNRGDGTFEDVARRAGVESPGWNTGAAFFDADGDGRLDLYIAAYIRAAMDDVLKATPTLPWKGIDRVAAGPFGLPGAQDHFFRAVGAGAFQDATSAAGLEDKAGGFGFGVVAADFDNDGDPDIYVANDSDPNYLYRNEGNGTFREVGFWSGAAFDINGAAQAGMGVAAGDVDSDGYLDLLATNFSEDFSTLYKGLGGCLFEDVSAKSGVGPATFLQLSWGAVMADLDNDGDLDIVIANGHIYPQIKRHPETKLAYEQRNQILENIGGGRFVDVSSRAGPGFLEARSYRGLAAGDYDNDGDLDLLFSSLDAAPLLLRNDSKGGSWLSVECLVPPGRGTAIGTRVEVRAAGKKWFQEVQSSSSYLSVHDPRLHFGLGAATRADEVKIRWPDGTTESLAGVQVNQFLTVKKKR